MPIRNRFLVSCISSISLFCAGTLEAAASNIQQPTAIVDSVGMEIDDLQIDLKGHVYNPKTRELQVSLFITSLKWKPRELKVNTYALQVEGRNMQRKIFSKVQLQQVLILADSKQNYLNYLLTQDLAAQLTVTFKDVDADFKPAQFFFVFENSEEEGHFIEQIIAL